jgi:hypothetical protein
VRTSRPSPRWSPATAREGWTHVFHERSVPLALTPGKHKVRVSYPLRGKATPVSPAVEFTVEK